MAKKTYVIATYAKGEPYYDKFNNGKGSIAMYESDDFRLLDNKIPHSHEVDLAKQVTITKGNYVRGRNGNEIGIFHGDNGKQYSIYSDHSAKEKI